MADRYARLKRQRQEERRLKLIADTTAKIGRLALQIIAIEGYAAPDIIEALHEVNRLTGIKP
jgi:hypothetical protein